MVAQTGERPSQATGSAPLQYERTASSFQKPFALTAKYAADRGGEAKEQSFVPNLNVRLICPDCQIDPPNLVEEFSSGDLVCADCGLVVGDRIVDTRSEWRTFANEEGDDPSRVGESSNPILDGLVESLDTRIGARDGGSGISRALQKTAQLGQGTQNRNVLEAFDDIQRKCDSIHLPKMVADTAKQLYRRAEESKVAKGKKTEAIVAAAIYVSCKVNKVPRTFPEICNLTKVKKKLIGQVFREMQAAFGLNAPGAQDGSIDAVGPTAALELVGRFCSRLGLEQTVVRVTEDIIIRVREAGVLAGKSPITISAACILFSVTMCMLNPPTAKQIAESAQVSDSTIKSSYREMLKSKDAVLTKEFLDKHKRVIDVKRLAIAA